MKSLLLVLVVTLAVVFMVSPNPHPFAWASEKLTGDTLRQTEGEFMKAATKHGSGGYTSYYAGDAVEVPNGAAIISGKVKIAKTSGISRRQGTTALVGLRWAPMFQRPAISATAMGLTSSAQSATTASLWWRTGTTPASGRSRRMEVGK
jgi:hypothetical protein